MIAPMRRACKRVRDMRNDALMTTLRQTVDLREFISRHRAQAHVFVKKFHNDALFRSIARRRARR
jgi:hypothetical protein